MGFKPKSKSLPGSYDLNQLKGVLLKSGLQQKDNKLFQVIDQLITNLTGNEAVVTSTIDAIEEIIVTIGDPSEIGYWSPLILDGEDNGDSEMVITDSNAPIAIWNPTPL